jgi:hypothetical protein
MGGLPRSAGIESGLCGLPIEDGEALEFGLFSLPRHR